jgi:hypothetical protein
VHFLSAGAACESDKLKCDRTPNTAGAAKGHMLQKSSVKECIPVVYTCAYVREAAQVQSYLRKTANVFRARARGFRSLCVKRFRSRFSRTRITK